MERRSVGPLGQECGEFQQHKTGQEVQMGHASCTSPDLMGSTR